MPDRCVFCGKNDNGAPFAEWVKPTFTDYDKLRDGDCICGGCLFWFDEASAQLASRVGKGKPQRMRNYSHFIVNGEWIPLSKSDKAQMCTLLLGEPFPELAVIAESGQKHIAFRAVRNPPNSKSGWVQFEEQRIWCEPKHLQALLEVIQRLYTVFSKGEIESGNYAGHRILTFGIVRWQKLEGQLRPARGQPLFQLAIFLAQRSDDDATASTGCESIDGDLARHSGGLQKPLSNDHLEPV